jgi:hypothetical protein
MLNDLQAKPQPASLCQAPLLLLKCPPNREVCSSNQAMQLSSTVWHLKIILWAIQWERIRIIGRTPCTQARYSRALRHMLLHRTCMEIWRECTAILRCNHRRYVSHKANYNKMILCSLTRCNRCIMYLSVPKIRPLVKKPAIITPDMMEAKAMRMRRVRGTMRSDMKIPSRMVHGSRSWFFYEMESGTHRYHNFSARNENIRIAYNTCLFRNALWARSPQRRIKTLMPNLNVIEQLLQIST